VRFAELPELPDEAEVVIEVPRGSFIKRRPDGSVEFVSPLPCPYNYGSVQGGLVAPDGDPFDALVFGRRVSVGTLLRAPVRAVMGFVDADTPDPKIVCSHAPLTSAQRRGVERFFRAYALLKRVAHRLEGRSGRTACLGWIPPA
jgi:inorganic pyrophosphatase